MKRMKSSVLFAIVFVGSLLLIHPEQMASAKGGKIAFSLDGEIYIIDADGKNLRRLTAHPAWDNWPVWLPDGRHIAFVSDRRGGFSTYTMELAGDNIAGDNIKKITNSGDRLAISPDGKWIAQTGGSLLLVAIDGVERREIRWGRPQGATNMAAWSPDGKKIAFTIRVPGVLNDIYVIDITGDNLRRLTNHPWQDLYPAWSPDGRWIAFWSNRDGHNAVYLMRADGANAKRLAKGRSPEWSPDGQQIAFVSRQEDIEGIFIIDKDGENTRLLVEGGDNPSWFDSKLAVSDAGKRITLWGRMKRETD